MAFHQRVSQNKKEYQTYLSGYRLKILETEYWVVGFTQPDPVVAITNAVGTDSFFAKKKYSFLSPFVKVAWSMKIG